jgi:predicted nuclease of predicted toxin-antitoxin system
MKIIIDQNISFRIIPHINHLFTEVAHVRMLSWTDAPDILIFRNAKQNGFDAILTLDEDFDNIILENSPPPKILWLRVRNCSTSHLAQIIKNKIDIINDFLIDKELDCLEIFDI